MAQIEQAQVARGLQVLTRWPVNAWNFMRRWPVVPLFVLVILAVCGIFAPWLAPQSTIRGDPRARHAPPLWLDAEWYEEHPRVTTRFVLGSDHAGRDILSRLIHGARISLMVASVSLTSGFIVGTAVGLVSGYLGGFWDEIITRIVDIWLALPFLMVALVVVLVLGQSLMVLLSLLAMVAWVGFVRVVRSQALYLKEMDYVALARVAGASPFRIMFRHLLPGVINSAVVIATLNVGGLILAEATLSFLGAGIPPPTPAWGVMVAEGRDYVGTAWWQTVFPGAAIFLTVMSLNFLGDWMRDRFDPRLRQLVT